MKFISLTVLLWSFVFTAPVFAEDPVGETAHYKVDNSRSRTSRLIRSGTFDVDVASYKAEQRAYGLVMEYELNVVLRGRESGQESLDAPQEYFTPEFWQTLREEGSYESEQFKVQHLGYATVRNMDGETYENCDKVRIYDIEQMTEFSRLGHQLARVDRNSRMEDMEIVAHVKEGFPVLGAVKLDVKARYSGQNIKAGADYLP